MKRIRILKVTLYIILLTASILLVTLYWNNKIDINTRVVLMSIGSSLLGSITLAVLIDLISVAKILDEKKIMLEDARKVAKEIIKELNSLCDALRKETIFDFDFKDEMDFIKKSTNLYFKYTDKRETESDKIASDIVNTTRKCIMDTFIVEVCEEATLIYEKLLNNKEILLVSGHLSKKEIKCISTANTRIKFFIKDFKENRFSILPTNNLKFRKHLELILGKKH